MKAEIKASAEDGVSYVSYRFPPQKRNIYNLKKAPFELCKSFLSACL